MRPASGLAIETTGLIKRFGKTTALAQRAEHGTQGATMPGIADIAGASLGLVQHRFGTKEALRKLATRR